MWLIYDPFTMISLILAYIVGFTILLFAAGYLAPRVARKFTNKFSLQASMIIIGLIIIVAGFAGVGITAYLLASLFSVEDATGLITSIILMVLVLNIISYLVSPLTINIMYGAKRNAQLQELVNDVARKLGFSKPPKAVLVNGPPNAFAYGNFLSGKYVAVTTGLMEIATTDELKAIIGHELGHHRHKDNTIMLFMGLIPSLLYFMGVFLMRVGFISGYARAYANKRRGGEGGLLLVIVGVLAVALSFIVQVLVLAFSRLREYYADSAGAFATSSRSMQRALARIHLYYNTNRLAREVVASSKIKALFIYAFTEAYANPFYRHQPIDRDIRNIDVDKVVEELKKTRTEDISEFFSTHPPIPKRIRFLDTLVFHYMEAP
ncbi:MAG: zinc metalloprotease HtpX [Desulfurococcaceae archaeon]